MKVIIAGSRDYYCYNALLKAIKDSGFNITRVVSGRARGVDSMGEKWALENNIPISYFPANWNKFGKSAGYKRNVEMGKFADAAICIWKDKSKGTEHMINIMSELNKPCYIIEV